MLLLQLFSPIAVAIMWVGSRPSIAYPSGAPLSACPHLLPIHEDAVAQQSPAPYWLLLSDTNYTSRRPITLTVGSQQPFLAFMLQARAKNSKRPVGRFLSPPQASQFLSCENTDDTLSHAAAYGRTEMTVIWQPPAEDVGQVSIVGSVAQNKYIFWVVESDIMEVSAPVIHSAADTPHSTLLTVICAIKCLFFLTFLQNQ